MIATMTLKIEDDHASTSSEEWPTQKKPQNSQSSPDSQSAPIRYQEIIGELSNQQTPSQNRSSPI